MHFTSKRIKQTLTEPIVSKWINAFEAIIGQHGHLYPVHDEPISLAQLASLCKKVQSKLDLASPETSNGRQPKVARKQAFSFFVSQFPELRQLPSIAIPFRDLPENDLHYPDTTLLRSLDIISSVYRSRDIDPDRPLTFFEAAKILTRIYHVLSGKHPRHKVFLAHASTDKDIVRDIRAALQTRGIACFFDEADIPLSADLRAMLVSQINAPETVVVVFISHTALQSDWLKFELECAMAAAKDESHKLLIVRLSEAPLPFELAGLRHSDFLHCRSKREYERLCDLEKNTEEIYFALLDLDADSAANS